MFGTGIFVTPTVVLAIVNSKGVALLLWLAGGLITWAGLVVLYICAIPWLTYFSLSMYLEYGIRFPLTGGELHYVTYFDWAQTAF